MNRLCRLTDRRWSYGNPKGKRRDLRKTLYESRLHHGRAELDAAEFIRAEENDKRTHIKKFRRKFYFFVKIRHIIYAIQNRLSCEPAFVYALHIQCEYRDKLHLLILSTGGKPRPRLVHASLARGIMESLRGKVHRPI